MLISDKPWPCSYMHARTCRGMPYANRPPSFSPRKRGRGGVWMGGARGDTLSLQAPATIVLSLPLSLVVCVCARVHTGVCMHARVARVAVSLLPSPFSCSCLAGDLASLPVFMHILSCREHARTHKVAVVRAYNTEAGTHCLTQSRRWKETAESGTDGRDFRTCRMDS